MTLNDIRLTHAAIIIDEAIDALIGTGTHSERLLKASRHLIGITPDEFDPYPELKAKFEELRLELSRTPSERYGSFAATIEKAGAARRRAIAKRFIDLDRAIRHAGNRSEGNPRGLGGALDLANLPFEPSVLGGD